MVSLNSLLIGLVAITAVSAIPHHNGKTEAKKGNGGTGTKPATPISTPVTPPKPATPISTPVTPPKAATPATPISTPVTPPKAATPAKPPKAGPPAAAPAAAPALGGLAALFAGGKKKAGATGAGNGVTGGIPGLPKIGA